MAIIEREPTRAPVGEPTTMKAAVVESFTAPLALKERAEAGRRPGRDRREGRDLRAVPHRHPRRARRLARQADAAVRPGARGHRDRRVGRRGRDRGRDRRPRGDAVARLRVRHLRVLRVGLGDALPRAEEHRLRDRRRLRRVREGVRPLRREGARRRRPGRRGAAHLRRRDDLQGGQGRGHAAVRTSSRSSASAGSATWRSSTRRSPAGAPWPSTWSTRSSRSRASSARPGP